jgi:hypothetical protein
LAGFALIFLISFAQSVPAEGLGRLFTTPDERARLEQLRHAPPVEEKQAEKEQESTALPPEPIEVPNVTVQGYVIRSDGSNTAWVNGQNSLDGDLESQHLRVPTRGIQGGRVSVQLPEGGRSVRLRPGQTFTPSASRVTDSYQKPVEKTEGQDSPK